MSKCYVYFHKRLDTGIVFYVGKGSGTRCKQKTKRSKAWRDIVIEAGGFSVEIYQKDLTDEEAYEIENKLIVNPEKGWNLINTHSKRHIVELDFDLFNNWFYYDPSSPSGLKWKQDVRRGRNHCILIYKKGSNAGSISYENYWHIGLQGKLYRAHRVVYLLVHGSISSDLSIDHLNNNRLDNRIENLRLLRQSENSGSTSIVKRTKILKRNTTGITGISTKVNKDSISVLARWRSEGREFNKRFNTKKLRMSREELIILAEKFLAKQLASKS